MSDQEAAFAYVVSGRIFINTVSSTPRAARVNAIVSVFGRSVFNTEDDQQIVARLDALSPIDGQIKRLRVEIQSSNL